MAGSDADTFASAIHRVKCDAHRAEAGVTNPAALVLLYRVAKDAEVMEHLQPEDLGRVASRDLSLAAIDAEQLAKLLEDPSDDALSDDNLERAALLSDRLMRGVGYIALKGSSSERAQLRSKDMERVSEDDSARALNDLVGQYRDDARRERAIMASLYVGAVLAMAAGVAIALQGVSAASTASRFRFSEFAAYGIIALVAAAFGATGVHRAARHGMAAQEATRLQRQFRALDAYLSPMPPTLRDLVRGTLAQRLFPAVLEGDEPWREPKWPDTEALLDAIRER